MKTEESTYMYTHRVYGKFKTDKQFKPMNLREGKFVTNLIYASMVSEDDARLQINFLNENNHDYIFEMRKI